MKCSFIFIFTAGILSAAMAAEGNLILNGMFSDSTATSWIFNSGSAQASGGVEQGRYVISIQTPGNDEASPQLFQQNIVPEYDEGYTLSFRTSADNSGFIRAFVRSTSNKFYSDTAAGKIPVSTATSTHSIDFFIQEHSGNATVVFNCGLSPQLTRIDLDSIVLVRKSEPVIVINHPATDARWISGTERHIEWRNSGTLEVVKIRFSSDSGASWSVITSAASNQNSFWWTVPAAVYGKNCLIIVSDTSGTIADTSGLFRIVEAGTIDAREMVKNGDFLDTTYWRFSVNSPAVASGAFKDDQFFISIDTIGDQPWQIKLEQPGFTLENGSMYRLSFDAYASSDRTIFANVGADNGDPAWSVFGGDSIPLPITTVKSRYYQIIIMKYPTSSNIRVEFNCGNDTGDVYIDNVSLIQMESANVLIFSPSLGTALKSGSTFNIEWHAAEVTTIDLEYSLDSGETWVSILDDADNLGFVAWNVPDESSENCFIRIRDAVGDTVIGRSSQFLINKFGTPVKTGELIVNGSFSNYEQGWNTQFNNAQGRPEFKDQQFAITINEPGDDISSIILSQTGLPVLSGKEYTVSCDVFSNGTRTMRVKIVADNDSLTVLDSAVVLPVVRQKIVFGFTSETDVMTRLEFHIGGSRAGVFIDNVSFITGGVPVLNTSASHAQRENTFTVTPAGKGVLFSVADENRRGTITVYNLHGAVLYRCIADAAVLWNGMNRQGVPVAPGSYIARYANGETGLSRRFLLR